MDEKLLKKLDLIDQKQDKQRVKHKRKTEELSAQGGVFDKYTVETINKFRIKGIIKEFVGIISAGKESNVYFAIGEDDLPLAVKIYKIDHQNTKWMKNYIIGDPRFKKIGSSTHKIIYTWCQKEFKNLKQIERHSIRVPHPIAAKNNVLIMEYIGDENGTPAPRLKDIDPSKITDMREVLNKVLDGIEIMYKNAHLVHGDLSEFNILFHDDQPIIIDVSQAVSIYHINAPVYLKRDIINVLNFFRHFLSDIPDVENIFQKILGR